MVPPISGGRKESRTRIRQGLPVDPIDLPSLDDSQNVVWGLTYQDRMVIVFAVRDAMARASPHSRRDPELRRDYLDYVGLTMLLQLVHHSNARWGYGALGAARPDPEKARNTDLEMRLSRLRRRQREARRPDRLLLNLVPEHEVLPQYRDLNFPVELRKLRDEHRKRAFDKGIYVESTWLTAEVALELTRIESIAPSNEEVTKVRDLARQQRAIPTPVLTKPMTHKTVGRVLDYYGLGVPARTMRGKGHYVKPWRLDMVVQRYGETGIIRLEDLPWMQGRYLFNGQPLNRPTPL